MNVKLFADSASKVFHKRSGRSAHLLSPLGLSLAFLLAVLVFAGAAAVVISHDLPLIMGGM